MQSQRLQIIYDLVGEGDIVADIGSDHGLLPLALVENERAGLVIASDINPASFIKLKRTLAHHKKGNRIITRIADGLKDWDLDQPEVIVLAGMGGGLIIQIIKSAPELVQGVQRLVIQANTQKEELRRFLQDFGFKICQERDLIEKEVYYNFIVAQPGKGNYQSLWDFKYGKLILEAGGDHTLAWLEEQKEITQNLLSGKLPEARREELEDKISEIEEIIRCYWKN